MACSLTAPSITWINVDSNLCLHITQKYHGNSSYWSEWGPMSWYIEFWFFSFKMALLPTVFAGRSLCMRCSKLLSVNPFRCYGMVYLPKYHHILKKDSAWLSRLPARTLLTETVSITDKAEFRIPEPEYDWDYLCDPKNRDAIQQNIINRKGVGNIDAVVSFLWRLTLLMLKAEYSSLGVSTYHACWCTGS